MEMSKLDSSNLVQSVPGAPPSKEVYAVTDSVAVEGRPPQIQ